MKPGLPLGRFDQWLTVTTNLEDAEKLKIPVIGRVVGNISVHGRPYWNEEQGVVRIGHVKSATGIRAPLNIVMKVTAVNGQPVAKLSDSPGKALCRDETFLAYLRQVFQIQAQDPKGEA